MLTTAPSHSGLLHGEARAFERKGRDPCLLAFHGFTGSPSEIMPVLQAAADAGFAVHAPLQPGPSTLATTPLPRATPNVKPVLAADYAPVSRGYPPIGLSIR